ncbi:MAG: proline iminopeptidase-family hydrolase [Phycisphaerales bacterium]|nr:proline iminopeptidase-family hydrolase [Phycisphaerales bacterium]
MRNFLFLLMLILFSTSISWSKQVVETSEGYIPVKGGKIWYQVVGSLKQNPPILLLHGGPGCPSYYLKPLHALSADRPVIFFDQLGAGHSTRITDTALMTIDNFVEQVETVVKYLGLKDYYLYGQSWGTMLATDFYSKYPEGIRAIILSNPSINMHLWEHDAQILISTLPDSIQTIIKKGEQDINYTKSDAYQRAIVFYYHQFVARKQPWAPDLDSSVAQMSDTIYHYMVGPSEFTINGTLKDYNHTHLLKQFKVPTLYIYGQYDEVRPSTIRYYQAHTNNAIIKMIPAAAHVTMQDQPTLYNESLSNFLTHLDKIQSDKR